jgi:hypothetical protein
VTSPDPLSSVSRCLSGRFRWLNHSYTHLNLDQTRWAPYSVAKQEIQENLRAGARLGIFPPYDVLKTGELSGLGFFDPARTDPYGDIGTPSDFGLGASNREFLRAARDVGVKVIHSNFSVASQRPNCHNCGIWHPLDSSLFLIPVRPNNVAFYVTTPDEETSFFNLFYGPGGLFPTFSQNLNYPQILDYNSEVAFFNLITGAVYADYFHQGNLRQYAPGKNLMFDWMNALMERYSRYYSIPVRNLIWSTGFNSISTYVQARTSHAGMAPRIQAIWDRSASTTGRVTVTAPSNQGGWVFLTGAQVGFQHTYGGDNISGLYLNPGQSLALNPFLRQ